MSRVMLGIVVGYPVSVGLDGACLFCFVSVKNEEKHSFFAKKTKSACMFQK